MADLLITTALTQIEEALRDTLSLALVKRLTVATLTALRALVSTARTHRELAYVTAALYVYAFDRFSTAADNGTTVIKPTDNPTAGRWLRTTSTTAAGYLKAVDLYEGESKPEEILGRFQVRPCAVIVWDGSENTPASQVPGALYLYTPRFVIWIVSSNLRREKQASLGSQIAAESADDPGANRILGDVKKVLAGSDLGQTGVKWCELRGESRQHTSLADRLMVYQLAVEVRAAVHVPDEDAVVLDTVRAFDAQYQLANLNDQTTLDRNNCIVSGLTVPMGVGLTKAIAAGSAKIAGAVVVYAGENKTFVAGKDTYRDLRPVGTLAFVDVVAGSEAPAVTATALRIGVTRADAAGVYSDRYIAASLADYGAVDQIPPT